MTDSFDRRLYGKVFRRQPWLLRYFSQSELLRADVVPGLLSLFADSNGLRITLTIAVEMEGMLHEVDPDLVQMFGELKESQPGAIMAWTREVWVEASTDGILILKRKRMSEDEELSCVLPQGAWMWVFTANATVEEVEEALRNYRD